MKMRNIASSLVLLCGVLGVPEHTEAQEKFALLIGIDRYLKTELPMVSPRRYAVEDVLHLAEALAGSGYDIRTLTDKGATRSRIISEISNMAGIAESGDTFIVYFAGDLVVNQRAKPYLLTYDAGLDSLEIDGIRLEHLLDFIGEVAAERKLLLFNPVFSGRVVESLLQRSRKELYPALDLSPAIYPVERISEHYLREGLVILAAKANIEHEVADHSPFANALVKAFSTERADLNRDSAVTVGELHEFVRRENREFAAAFGGDPEVTLTTARRPDWPVRQTVTVDEIELAREWIDRYTKVLEEWRAREWVSLRTQFTCRLALEEYWEAIEASMPPAPYNEQIVRIIVDVMKEANLDERTRAQILEEKIREMAGSY